MRRFAKTSVARLTSAPGRGAAGLGSGAATQSPRRMSTPAKTTLFAGRVCWLRANIPRKSPQAIFAYQNG
jgi:hypothetical protein